VRRLGQLARIGLLVLDDFLLTPPSVIEAKDLLEVIDDRSQVRSTLVVSQLPVEAWHPALAGGDPTLADAILVRLVQHAHACHSLARPCADASHHPRRTDQTPLRNDSPPADQQRACGACGCGFPARGRKAYCSDACRQRGFRLRRRPADELPLGFARRLPKTAIVYQCPECDARLLGQQRCEECGVFGRRLGPGGPCPHCNEVVAISDLLADLRSITIAAGR